MPDLSRRDLFCGVAAATVAPVLPAMAGETTDLYFGSGILTPNGYLPAPVHLATVEAGEYTVGMIFGGDGSVRWEAHGLTEDRRAVRYKGEVLTEIPGTRRPKGEPLEWAKHRAEELGLP